ncbi:hypothetical protein RZS08_20615, partial [Arthrospira platensis SPKY1]|nr:hypothetical protein [Arthrospira platensis SPKY1]
ADTHRFKLIRSVLLLTALFFLSLFVTEMMSDYRSEWAPILMAASLFHFLLGTTYHRLATSRHYFKIRQDGIEIVSGVTGKPVLLLWEKLDHIGIQKGVLHYRTVSGQDGHIVLRGTYSKSQIVEIKWSIACLIRRNQIKVRIRV